MMRRKTINMKKILMAMLAISLGSAVHAQQRLDTAVLLKLPVDPANVTRFKQKLVELALRSPDVRKYALQKQMVKYETTIAGAKWANHFSASGNLNEFTIENKGSANTFFPRYNFGVTLPIGNLIAIPAEVKRTRANAKLIDVQKESEVLQIKARVLRYYEEYAANKRLLELHQPILEDALVYFNQIEDKFKTGDKETNITTYKEAYKFYNDAMTQRVVLERNLRQSKVDLEGIVGMTLEEVMLQL